MSYLEFHDVTEAGATRLTRTWLVTPRGAMHDQLATVYWYTHWRRYVARPANGAVFDAACLAELAEFLEGRTREQQEAAARRRAQAAS